MLIVSLLLLFLAGFCEGIMDTLQFHFHISRFSLSPKRYYWDPTVSWRNKYLNNDPLLGPRFPLSTTFLVSLTDGWHTFKLLRNICIFAALPLLGFSVSYAYELIALIVAGRTTYGAGFWLAYYKVLRIR
jgi:hypothetical protein